MIKINNKEYKIVEYMKLGTEISKYLKQAIIIEGKKEACYTLQIRIDNSWYVLNVMGKEIAKGKNFETDLIFN